MCWLQKSGTKLIELAAAGRVAGRPVNGTDGDLDLAVVPAIAFARPLRSPEPECTSESPSTSCPSPRTSLQWPRATRARRAPASVYCDSNPSAKMRSAASAQTAQASASAGVGSSDQSMIAPMLSLQ